MEARPAGGEPFRVEIKAKVPIFHKPRPGDVVKVSFDPKSHKTEIHIEGDPRYDPKLIRARSKQERSAQAEALLNGAPALVASGVVHYIADDEPRWNVPATCPECGARVDQSTASFAEHPHARTARSRCRASPQAARTTRGTLEMASPSCVLLGTWMTWVLTC